MIGKSFPNYIWKCEKENKMKVYLIGEYNTVTTYRAFRDDRKAMLVAREIHEECCEPEELETEWEDFLDEFDGPYCFFEIVTVE